MGKQCCGNPLPSEIPMHDHIFEDERTAPVAQTHSMQQIDHPHNGPIPAQHEDLPVLRIFENAAQSGSLLGAVGSKIGFLCKKFAKQLTERRNIPSGRFSNHSLNRSISTP